jgi:hypothetical protein
MMQPSGKADLSGLARVICLAGQAEVQGFAGLLVLIWLRGVIHPLDLRKQEDVAAIGIEKRPGADQYAGSDSQWAVRGRCGDLRAGR